MPEYQTEQANDRYLPAPEHEQLNLREIGDVQHFAEYFVKCLLDSEPPAILRRGCLSSTPRRLLFVLSCQKQKMPA